MNLSIDGKKPTFLLNPSILVDVYLCGVSPTAYGFAASCYYHAVYQTQVAN
jgi:hypothetical protein